MVEEAADQEATLILGWTILRNIVFNKNLCANVEAVLRKIVILKNAVMQFFKKSLKFQSAYITVYSTIGHYSLFLHAPLYLLYSVLSLPCFLKYHWLHFALTERSLW